MATITGAQGQQLVILPGLSPSNLTEVDSGQTIPPSTGPNQVLAILGGSGVPSGDKGTGTGQYEGIVVLGGSFVNGVFVPNGSIIVDPGVNLEIPAAGVAGFSGALTIDATSGHNTITGGANAETVFGGDGDSLTGGSGANLFFSSSAETIVGGSGPTTIFGAAADTIKGGSGATIIHGASAENITGGSGPTTIFGAATDTILGGSGATFIKSAGNERITGGSGPTTIRGGVGDTIFGGAGKTKMRGGAGNERLKGGQFAGAGDTTITGGQNDTLQGGYGSNRLNLNFIANQTVSDRHTHGRTTAQDTVYGFDQTVNDRITFGNETEARINQVLGTAKEVTVKGFTSTEITLPNGAKITLVGITHVDSSFFG